MVHDSQFRIQDNGSALHATKEFTSIKGLAAEYVDGHLDNPLKTLAVARS